MRFVNLSIEEKFKVGDDILVCLNASYTLLNDRLQLIIIYFVIMKDETIYLCSGYKTNILHGYNIFYLGHK